MFQQTIPEIEHSISEYLGSAVSISSILSFDLGPKSSAAKTHMYFSADYAGPGGKPITLYTIVSERATQLLVEKGGSSAVKMLYAQANLIQNPAFFGWVVEADYFSRCSQNTLMLRKKGNSNPIKFECQVGSVVNFECAHLKLLQSFDEQNIMRQAVHDLIPTVAGQDKAKSVTHSLKLQYFHEFMEFLKDAGHEIASVEIGFIMPTGKMDKFRVTHDKVTGAGLFNTVPLYPATDATTWQQSKEHEQITVYGLPDIKE